jgi:hypothetical protein
VPRLCREEHGRKDVARTEADQVHYRPVGKTIPVVTGSLKRTNVRFDRCTAPLKTGARAYLLTAFLRHLSNRVSAFAYIYAECVLTLARARVKVHELPPRSGIPSPTSVLGTR